MIEYGSGIFLSIPYWERHSRKWKIESEELITEMREEGEEVNQRKYNVINLDREGRT